jgi:NAD(P) transhydrogenase
MVKEDISVQDLAFRVRAVVGQESEVVRAQLKRNRIDVIDGMARFADPHTIEAETEEGALRVQGDYVMIACGSRPARDANIPIDGERIFDADQLLRLANIPRNMIVVGAGVIGLEYASMLAALNTEVTLIEARPTILDFVDREIIDTLAYHMRQLGATFRLGEKVVSVTIDDRGRVVAALESGKRVIGDGLLYAVGRQGNADQIRIEAAGLAHDDRGRVKVNASYQTDVPHIYAGGDVIGFPSLASSSMEQGRLAACHMFGMSCTRTPELLPYGIYTIPEISMVGKTEQQLTSARVPYEFGIAKYDELAKGQMIGDRTGLVKLLFDPDSRKLLGVHAIGEQATEIVHIGQAVMSFGGGLEYFRDTVFNYPTLAEAYRVAALDGLNKL